MIEADVSIGKLIVGKEIKEDEVIMAHFPDEVYSDLSLEEFLKQIHEMNIAKPTEAKGIKLDFKTTNTFFKSNETLKKYVRSTTKN